jgi:hypothetical protein
MTFFMVFSALVFGRSVDRAPPEKEAAKRRKTV